MKINKLKNRNVTMYMWMAGEQDAKQYASFGCIVAGAHVSVIVDDFVLRFSIIAEKRSKGTLLDDEKFRPPTLDELNVVVNGGRTSSIAKQLAVENMNVLHELVSTVLGP